MSQHPDTDRVTIRRPVRLGPGLRTIAWLAATGGIVAAALVSPQATILTLATAYLLAGAALGGALLLLAVHDRRIQRRLDAETERTRALAEEVDAVFADALARTRR